MTSPKGWTDELEAKYLSVAPFIERASGHYPTREEYQQTVKDVRKRDKNRSYMRKYNRPYRKS